MFRFPEPLSNACLIAKDAPNAGFIVVNGWVGRPGDKFKSRTVVLNPRGEVVFDGVGPIEPITNELSIVLAQVVEFHFGVPGWHKIQIYNDQELKV